MTVVPAQAAGVAEIAVVVPPTPFGGYNADLLAACHALGVKEVHRVGGAQAVAALAYGVEGIAPVDKIVGPGNLFVALAKRQVYGEVDIDGIAGPSEVVLIADWTADPRYVAADLISQAEHSPGASILITWEADLIDRVAEALAHQFRPLSRGDLARESLERFGALILVRDEDEAVRLSNLIAPEHLHVSTVRPRPPRRTPHQRRRDLPGPRHAGRPRRLRRRPVARPAHRRHGAVGVGALVERLPEADELDPRRPRRPRRARPRRPHAGRQGRPDRPPLQRRRPARRPTGRNVEIRREPPFRSRSGRASKPIRTPSRTSSASWPSTRSWEDLAERHPDDFRAHLFGPEPSAEAIARRGRRRAGRLRPVTSRPSRPSGGSPGFTSKTCS